MPPAHATGYVGVKRAPYMDETGYGCEGRPLPQYRRESPPSKWADQFRFDWTEAYPLQSRMLPMLCERTDRRREFVLRPVRLLPCRSDTEPAEVATRSRATWRSFYSGFPQPPEYVLIGWETGFAQVPDEGAFRDNTPTCRPRALS